MSKRTIAKEVQRILDADRPTKYTPGKSGKTRRFTFTDEQVNKFDDTAYGFDTLIDNYQPYLHRKYKANKPEVIATLVNHMPARDVNELFKRGPHSEDNSAMLPVATMKYQMDKYFKKRPLEWKSGGKKKSLEYTPTMEFAFDAVDTLVEDKNHRIDKETIASLHAEKEAIAKILSDNKQDPKIGLDIAIYQDDFRDSMYDAIAMGADIGGAETAR